MLFAGEDEVPALVERLMAEAPAALGPMAVIAHGLTAFVEAVFEGRGDALRLRRTVINTDEGLRERELRKVAVLSERVRQGFLKRGADELTATLAAEIGMTVFRTALTRWLDQADARSFFEVIADTLAALRAMAADISAPA